MSDFFGELARRSTGETQGIAPRLPSAFEPSARDAVGPPFADGGDAVAELQLEAQPAQSVRAPGVPGLSAVRLPITRAPAEPPPHTAPVAPVTRQVAPLSAPNAPPNATADMARPTLPVPSLQSVSAAKTQPPATIALLPVEHTHPKETASLHGALPPLAPALDFDPTRVLPTQPNEINHADPSEKRLVSVVQQSALSANAGQLKSRTDRQQQAEPLKSTRLEPRPRRSTQTEARTQTAEPTIHVTIGRIEVRAQTGPTAPKPRSTPPVMSLEEYLHDRQERAR